MPKQLRMLLQVLNKKFAPDSFVSEKEYTKYHHSYKEKSVLCYEEIANLKRQMRRL
jgi:hypothetical protein